MSDEENGQREERVEDLLREFDQAEVRGRTRRPELDIPPGARTMRALRDRKRVIE